MILSRGACDIAAIHLLDPASQEYNLPFIKQRFIHGPITVIRIASREKGLMVAKGNPKKARSEKTEGYNTENFGEIIYSS